MPAVKPDMRTRANMAAGAPGEWEHKPLLIPEYDVRPPRVVDPRFKADPSKKPASTGPRPYPPRTLDAKAPAKYPNSAIRNLIRVGADQANAGDVFGHNERERSQLPNRPITSNTTFRSQEKAPRKKPGFAAIGSVGVTGAHVHRKPKKAKGPKARKGYVYEVPERLKKYASK